MTPKFDRLITRMILVENPQIAANNQRIQQQVLKPLIPLLQNITDQLISIIKQGNQQTQRTSVVPSHPPTTQISDDTLTLINHVYHKIQEFLKSNYFRQYYLSPSQMDAKRQTSQEADNIRNSMGRILSLHVGPTVNNIDLQNNIRRVMPLLGEIR